MTDVHIIGAGIHPFGRHDDKTGLDQGVFAAREALADAGLDWTQMQFGVGGSSAAASWQRPGTPAALHRVPVGASGRSPRCLATRRCLAVRLWRQPAAAAI